MIVCAAAATAFMRFSQPEEFMDHGKTQGSSQTNKSPNYMANSPTGEGGSVTDSLARGKDAVGAAASDAINSASDDFNALRRDLNSLKDTVTRFASQAGNEAARSAREITSNVAGQVGDVSSDLADKGAHLASSATQQAKTFAAELESMARRNPLGAIAGAVIVGVLIGMMGRRNA
jgi:ElaB/YqjD/DUF883 family membrane-anchored ribosome-binding protein